MTKSPQFDQAVRAWMDVFMHRSMRGWAQFAKSSGLSMPQFSLVITDKGRELVRRGAQERYHWVDDLAGKLSATERVKVSEALEMMTKAVKELEADAVHKPA